MVCKPRFYSICTFIGILCFSAWSTPVFAADVTVCDSGCDYTTISDAITGGGFSSGDTIHVQSPYASTTESFTLFPPADVNLVCQDSGVVIGIDSAGPAYILPQGGNTIQGCHFNHVLIQTDFASTTIQDNDFMSTSKITGSNTNDLLIENNEGIYSVSWSGIQNSIVTDNRFNTIGSEFGGLSFSSVTGVQITLNDIVDNVTSTNTNYSLMRIGSHSFDVYFATNTMSTPYATYYGGGSSRIEINQSRQIVLSGNLFSFSGSGGGVQVLNFNGSSGDIAIDAQHNTILLNNPCYGCAGILMTNWNVSDVSVTSAYNLIAATTPSSTANMQAHSAYGAGSASSLHLFTDYEGFVNLNTTGTTDFPAASNAITLHHSPFKINDATSTNDNELVPYSAFLDVNGTEDIGSVTGTRGNDFTIDSAGTIDYVSVHATNTGAIDESLRDGDTVHFVYGTYDPIQLIQRSIWPNPLTGNLTIYGNGSTIQATSTGSALIMRGVSTSTFSDLLFANATGTTVSSAYTITRDQFSDGVDDYDQGSFLGVPNGVIFIGSVPSGNSCSTSFVNADGGDITTVVGAATDNWNLALVDYLGVRLTIFAPSRYIANATDLQGCANPGEITVHHFVDDVFLANGNGTFTYNAAAVSGAGVAPKTGETVPPEITRAQSFGSNAGIVLDDSHANSFTNVSSTNNPFGVMFRGASAGNVFTNSALYSNNGYDVLGYSSGNNLFVDTSFTRTSNAFPGTGSLTAKYSVTAHVQYQNGQAINGISVDFVSANSVSSTSAVTNSSGDASSGPLPAFTLSSSTSLLTGGGFNPYVISTPLFGVLLATSTQATVSSTGQIFTLTALSAAQISAGGGSSGGGGGGGGGGIPLKIPATGFSEESGNASRIASLNALGYAVHDLVKLKDDGNPKTQDDTTVYYLGADGRRHAFPHFSVYFTWYCDFSKVKIIPADQLATIPLGKNVTYRPGIRLVKFVSVPTVYLVQTGGILRAIADERTAAAIAGPAWAKSVYDINDAFYLDYTIDGALAGVGVIDASPTYPSGSMHISGYSDPGIVSGILSCMNRTAFRFTEDIQPWSTNVVAIKELQKLLGIPQDGIYASETIQAVRAYQAEHGLPNTGIVGPLTREQLNADLAGR